MLFVVFVFVIFAVITFFFYFIAFWIRLGLNFEDALKQVFVQRAVVL